MTSGSYLRAESESRCGECGGHIGADHRCDDCGTLHNGPSGAYLREWDMLVFDFVNHRVMLKLASGELVPAPRVLYLTAKPAW